MGSYVNEPMVGSSNVSKHWVDTFKWFEPIVKPHVEPNVYPPVEPNVEPPVEPNVQPHMEPNFETHVEDVSGGEVIDTIDSEDIEDNTNSDFIGDEDNMLDDPNVDMKDFHLNIDKEVEWVRNVQHQLLSHSSIM